jgi:hypothetical protein
MFSKLPTTARWMTLVALVLVMSACTETTPLTSPETGAETDPVQSTHVASVTCTANVVLGELSCGKVPVVDGMSGLSPNFIIVGGQGVFVQLTSTNVSYNSVTEIFQADVAVQNLILQGLGSADGITTTGVRVFFHSGPNLVSGSGTVTVDNADGTGTFTQTNQPFHFYDTFLPPFFTTSPKTWRWNVPTTVTTFEFTVFVDADILNPDGFVLMSPPSALMSVGGGTVTVIGIPVDAVTRLVSGTVTYTSSDNSVATVGPSTGVVTPQGPGIADIIGSTTGPEADGIMRVTVDPPTTSYDIDLHFVSTVTMSQRTAFENAATRLEGLITGDLATEQVAFPFLCGGATVNEWVDDLAINVVVAVIDGVGGTLARAGWCWFRLANGLPAFGQMIFDIDDVAQLEADGQLGDVVLHEMLHVLGFGTRWVAKLLLSDNTGVLTGCPDTPMDPFFSGPLAFAAFNNNGGLAYTLNKVPLEDGFGDGTRCFHWDETVMNDELMTGFAEAPMTAMPFSEVTVASLDDMSYTVATSGWDPWGCPAPCLSRAGGATPAALQGEKRQLINDVIFGPIYSRDRDGRVILVQPGRQ